MAMYINMGKGGYPTKEAHDVRWGWTLLTWEQQEEITKKFWTYPAITYNEKERCREWLREDRVLLDRYYNDEDDSNPLDKTRGLVPEPPMRDQGLNGDVWVHLPYVDREALCNEEWAAATLEERRRVITIIEEQRNAERWMRDLLQEKRTKLAEDKERMYDMFNVKKGIGCVIIGKNGERKGELPTKKGGGREKTVKAPVPSRLKRRETDCDVLVPLGSKGSESTLSE